MKTKGSFEPSGAGTTFYSVAPTAKIAAWGGLITALKWSIPIIPRLEIEKVPPTNSAGVSLFSLAF